MSAPHAQMEKEGLEKTFQFGRKSTSLFLSAWFPDPVGMNMEPFKQNLLLFRSDQKGTC